MLTVYDAAQLGGAIYSPTSKWDLLLSGPDYADSTVGVIVDDIHGAVLVAHRGTFNDEDVLKDVEAAFPDAVKGLGEVGLGFFRGTPAVFEAIEPLLRKRKRKLIAIGHSLGGAQAEDLAGWADEQGYPAYAGIQMAPPCAGGAMLGTRIKKVPIWWNFRNGDDPIYLVPSWWTHSRDVTLLDEPGPPLEGPIGRHHVELYLAGIKKRQFPPLIA